MLKTNSSIKVKLNETNYLVPFGDVHYGNRDADINEFKRMLRECNKPNHYFIGLGDIFDSIIQQDVRFQLSQLDGMDPKLLVDDLVDSYVKQFSAIWEAADIPPDRILLIGMGNHEETLQRKYGTNPTKRFCEQCGILYGGYSGYHRLSLEYGKTNSYNVHIRYHHGYGGGSRTGGYPITKYERELMWSDADIFLFGHDHRRHLQPYAYEKMSVNGEYVYKARRVLAICGGFLENRPMTEYPSYGERSMYPASDMGYIKIPMQVTARKLGRTARTNRKFVEFPVFE